MTPYSNSRLYEILKKELMAWVWNNPRLLHKITRFNLEFLFEFDPQHGLSIDLRRFDHEYYKTVFYPPEEKKKHIDEFVRKCCLVISQHMAHAGKTDLTITITVRHMISEVSHWHTFFIDERYHGKKTAELKKKETDWHYRFNND
ncbi:hypothetical protein SAMN05192574_104770 [Mucilaginibacter gossypiicola]|uniref:Uncharacterized protein n=1 Tax=Mucilaginibacter gossypiicola TaxID=551995 RepID=A0A1H8KTH7_9SPHI|nr:hypothetical protein [Mucilaginibacter gossypiicola]SEN96189.1 hypothetical protein SAMN05192574_104770 [Mucilaginibacter gossypiicola]